MTGAVGDLDGDPDADAGDYAGRLPAEGTQVSHTSGATGANQRAHRRRRGGQLVDLIKKAVTSIGNVHLVATGNTAEFVASINPAGGYGPLPETSNTC